MCRPYNDEYGCQCWQAGYKQAQIDHTSWEETYMRGHLQGWIDKAKEIEHLLSQDEDPEIIISKIYNSVRSIV